MCSLSIGFCDIYEAFGHYYKIQCHPCNILSYSIQYKEKKNPEKLDFHEKFKLIKATINNLYPVSGSNVIYFLTLTVKQRIQPSISLRIWKNTLIPNYFENSECLKILLKWTSFAFHLPASVIHKFLISPDNEQKKNNFVSVK